MKRFGTRFLSAILVLSIISGLLCTAASALVESSEYLDGYRVVMTPDSNGDMVIGIDVSGRGYMSQIGAKKIYVYESSNGIDFYWVATYSSTFYPQMMDSGTFYYKEPITHHGSPGLYYYATACVYAGNSSGGDERYCDSAIKQAVSYAPPRPSTGF